MTFYQPTAPRNQAHEAKMRSQFANQVSVRHLKSLSLDFRGATFCASGSSGGRRPSREIMSQGRGPRGGARWRRGLMLTTLHPTPCGASLHCQSRSLFRPLDSPGDTGGPSFPL